MVTDTERSKAWREKNPERFKQYQETYKETHREQRRQYMREYKKKNPWWSSNYRSRHRRKIKLQLIEFLGGKCKNCGETDPDVLVFDHKNNDGRKERRGLGYATVLKYYWNHLREAKKKLMILCHNCNWRKEMTLRELKRLERIKVPPF